jgi:hypothetical protein
MRPGGAMGVIVMGPTIGLPACAGEECARGAGEATSAVAKDALGTMAEVAEVLRV